MIEQLIKLLGPGPFIVVSALLLILGFYLGVISSRVNDTALAVADLKVISKSHESSIMELTKIANTLSVLSEQWSEEIRRLRDLADRHF